MTTSSNGYRIREIQERDIPAVVEVHLASFQNFFLSFLGSAFLHRLYLEIAREPGRGFFVATQEQAVIGFAAGVPDLPGFYRRISWKKWLSFGLASTRAALSKPAIIPRLFRALTASKAAREAACPAALMSIAVAPEAKGAGAGRQLVHHFLQHMSHQGIRRVCLETDRDDNEATLRFYEGLGFQRIREHQTPEGRWMCEYVIDIDESLEGNRGGARL
jgi:ribosomal protein S18 acetylase RimI-like enzyme